MIAIPFVSLMASNTGAWTATEDPSDGQCRLSSMMPSSSIVHFRQGAVGFIVFQAIDPFQAHAYLQSEAISYKRVHFWQSQSLQLFFSSHT